MGILDPKPLTLSPKTLNPKPQKGKLSGALQSQGLGVLDFWLTSFGPLGGLAVAGACVSWRLGVDKGFGT